jgi:hypothetical protein
MKLSEDPVTSAKAASADELTSNPMFNAFRHLRRSNNCLEGNSKFISEHFGNMFCTQTIENYIYFLRFLLALKTVKFRIHHRFA